MIILCFKSQSLGKDHGKRRWSQVRVKPADHVRLGGVYGEELVEREKCCSSTAIAM